MSAAIDFYFEFYSPYGYLASLRIDDVAAKHGREVNWRPFMLGPAFKATGHQPLLDVPIMGEYSERDMYRCAREMNVPFKIPEDFPKASLNSARAFYALVDDDPDIAKKLAKAVYHRTFGEGQDGTRIELIAEIAGQLGLDADALVEKVQTQAIKDRLKQETQAAIDRGVFGSPFFFVDGEPFWGNDRIGQLDRWLETGGW